MTQVSPGRTPLLHPIGDKDVASKDFDYGTLDPVPAAELKGAANTIRDLLKRTTKDFVMVGQELLVVRNEKLPRGEFGKWLATEFAMSERMAQRFMSLAKFADSHPDILSGLEPSAAYLLSAPSTPANVVSEVKALVSHGEAITVKRVRALVSTARSDQQQAKGRQLAPKRRVRSRYESESSKVARARRKQERQAAKDFARLVGERIADCPCELLGLLNKTEAAALVDALRAELERRAARTLALQSEEVALPEPATPVSDPLEIPEALRRVPPATSGNEAEPRDVDQLK